LNNCKRCGRVLKSEKSIERGYGLKCYRIMQLNQQIAGPNNPNMENLLNRVRKLELDNKFMKHQLKHKTFIGTTSKDSELNWDIPKEVMEVRNQYKIEFNVIIKELKVIFTEDFNYHDVLKPINGREQPEESPIMDFSQIELAHLTS